ncbi:T3SS (YopN, CesT) and YbjN peptide-binding chaperone 1 [Micromonospora halophytica]
MRLAIRAIAESLKLADSGGISVPVAEQEQEREQSRGQGRGGDYRSSAATGHDQQPRPSAAEERGPSHPAYRGSPSISEREPIEFWALVGRWIDEGEKAQTESAAASRDGGTESDMEPLEEVPLEEAVKQVVALMTKVSAEDLKIDGDGDIEIRAGSAAVFVRTRDAPPLVDVFSPVLMDVEQTHELLIRLSEFSNRLPIGRLYYAAETVWASIPVYGRYFQSAHLMLAVQVMIGLADELDDRLKAEFGGRRFFE